jgi:hypothetical protein
MTGNDEIRGFFTAFRMTSNDEIQGSFTAFRMTALFVLRGIRDDAG